MENIGHPRVIVNVDHSVAGYAALRVAVGIARSRRVPLQAVHAKAGMGTIDNDYINSAFHEALGGFPPDVELSKTTVSESTSAALSKSAHDPRDLIVVGNDGRGMFRAVWSGSVARYLLKHVRCQVLVVAAPEMQRSTRRSARKLRRARTDVWDRFESEVPELRGRPYQGA
jgi:nucleotide-binding universal stress UspA family protein